MSAQLTNKVDILQLSQLILNREWKKKSTYFTTYYVWLNDRKFEASCRDITIPYTTSHGGGEGGGWNQLQ